MRKSDFVYRILSPNGGVSSRRFIALVMSIHFIVTSYYALFTRTTIANVGVQMKILEYEFWIILGGFGFIALSDFGAAFIKRAQAEVVKAEGLPEPEPEPEPEKKSNARSKKNN